MYLAYYCQTQLGSKWELLCMSVFNLAMVWVVLTVGRIERASAPSNVAKIDVAVLTTTLLDGVVTCAIKEEAHLTNATCAQRYFSQEAVLPPPVSVFNACRLLVRSQVARGWKASAILSVTHSACVPELSLSRYLWTSKIRPVVELSGFVIGSSAAPDYRKLAPVFF